MSSYKTLKNKYISALSEIENLSKNNKNNSETIIQKSASRVYRHESDIQRWRNGLNLVESIENPLFVELMKIYREIDLDSEITSVKTIRKNYIKSRDCIITKNGEENEDITKFFKKKWFFDFIDAVLESQYWGHSLIQINGIKDDEITGVEIVQRQNVNPLRNTILKTPYSNADSINFTEPKMNNWYILASDSKYDNYTGIYNKIAPYQIMLKFAQLSFSDYSNRFGSPSIIAKSEMINEEHVQNLETYLSDFMNSSYAIVGKHDDIELVESSGNSGDIYEKLIAEMKSNITKLILGNDTINSEKSFVGSSQIAEAQANIFSLSDVRFVEYYVNEELIPRLIRLGLTFLDGVNFRFDTTNKAKPEEEFKMLIELLKTGKYTADVEMIKEKFGIELIQSVENEAEDKNNNDKDV